MAIAMNQDHKYRLPEDMLAACSYNYSDYSGISVERRKLPTAKQNELLVKVMASTATTADSLMRAGVPKFSRLFMGLRKPNNPYLGTGFSGVVVACGAKVTGYKVGDQIFGETGLNFAANAEYLVVDADGVIFKKPNNLPHAQAACMTDGPLTSYNFLNSVSQAKPGMHVLVNGGAGSLGNAAIAIAKAQGCTVTATSSPHNFEFLKALGADHTLDYRDHYTDEAQARFDIIYDTVGKLDFSMVKSMLKPEAVFVSPVLSFRLLVNSLVTKVFSSKKRASFSATGLKKPDELKAYIQKLLKLYKEKRLSIYIDQSFNIQEVAQAHKLIAQGHKKGNFVITFDKQA